jgi:ketosteroid isomerase-like protein
MADQLDVSAPDRRALEVARAAFVGLQRGAATGNWSGFLDLLAEDVKIMIPVPAEVENPPEGLLVGKAVARELFASHHDGTVRGARLEAKRVTANGPLVVLECRVEGNLNGEVVANHFVFAFEVEVEAGRIAGMYEYATWTAKGPGSGWGDVAFAREAFPTTVIPYDEARFADVAPTG